MKTAQKGEKLKKPKVTKNSSCKTEKQIFKNEARKMEEKKLHRHFRLQTKDDLYEMNMATRRKAKGRKTVTLKNNTEERHESKLHES